MHNYKIFYFTRWIWRRMKTLTWFKPNCIDLILHFSFSFQSQVFQQAKQKFSATEINVHWIIKLALLTFCAGQTESLLFYTSSNCQWLNFNFHTKKPLSSISWNSKICNINNIKPEVIHRFFFDVLFSEAFLKKQPLSIYSFMLSIYLLKYHECSEMWCSAILKCLALCKSCDRISVQKCDHKNYLDHFMMRITRQTYGFKGHVESWWFECCLSAKDFYLLTEYQIKAQSRFYLNQIKNDYNESNKILPLSKCVWLICPML